MRRSKWTFVATYDPDNFWNPYIRNIEETRPDTYTSFLDNNSLQGKVLGLPSHYIGKGDPDEGESFPLDPQVAAAFGRAKQVLEAQGATLVEVDIPAHTSYFIDEEPEAYFEGLSERNLKTRAYYYEQLIKGYDNEEIQSFVDLLDILSEDYVEYEYVKEIADTIENGEAQPWEALPKVAAALEAIAQLRNQEYENFMSADGIDAFVFPTLNYLAPPQGPEGDAVYETYGSLPARFEANILGVPGITVPMGYSQEGIPMSLEFMGNFFGEAEIISYAYDYEQATLFRRAPGLPIPEPTTVPAILLIGAGVLVKKAEEGRRQKADGRR